MTVSKAMRMMRLQEWSKQIVECENSGLSVSEWCERNGIGYKSYYYRKRRVREELIDAADNSGEALVVMGNSSGGLSRPVFAQLAAPTRASSDNNTAATVQIGTYIAEINNGADPETVEGVLRTLSSL